MEIRTRIEYFLSLTNDYQTLFDNYHNILVSNEKRFVPYFYDTKATYNSTIIDLVYISRWLLNKLPQTGRI